MSTSLAAGRAYAAYGGVYIAASLSWLWIVEGTRPDRWDILGAAICLVGAAVSSPVPSCGSSRSVKEPHIAGSGEDKMAWTPQTTDTRTTTYALLVIFTVHPNSEQNLRDQQGIRDEAQSWLESVGTTVHGVNVRKADAA